MLYILALPLLVFLSFKPKYKQSIPARFFLFKNPKFTQTQALWFHVCSFGESVALAPIIEALHIDKINITTITQTGYERAQKYNAQVRYLPYEMFLPFWIRPQKVLVVLEAEFWFMLFFIAKLQGAKIVLLNARIADKSVDSYMKYSWFYKKMLLHVDIIFAQSEVDKNRFLALGAKHIEVIGNIKLAGKITATHNYEKPESEVIVAGSTHEGEEVFALDAFMEYRKTHNAHLVVVPRHPERFDEVYTLMQKYAQEHNLTLTRFSQEKNFDADLVLVDMMGELNNIYNIADIALLGGAFNDNVGGHNPLEPAYFGCKIITGEHFFHQKELFRYVHHIQYVKSEADAILEALEKAKTLPPSKVDEKINLEQVIETLENYMK